MSRTQPPARQPHSADKFPERQSAGITLITLITLINYENPGSCEEFVDHAVPTLQGDRLPGRHRDARYRGAFGKAAGSETEQGAFA